MDYYCCLFITQKLELLIRLFKLTGTLLQNAYVNMVEVFPLASKILGFGLVHVLVKRIFSLQTQ